MKRVLAIMLSMIMTIGAIAYAVESEPTSTEIPIATEAPKVTETPNEEADITVDPETGEPEIEVKGTVLVKDVDYILSYKDNVNVGTASVIVTFIGNYAGMKEQTFSIVPKPTSKPSSGGGGGGGGGGSRSTRVTLAEVTPQPTAEPVYIYHDAYIKGYDDGTFKPDAYITRAEAAAMLSRVMPTETPEPTATPTPNVRLSTTQTPIPTVKPTPKAFTDVKKTDWCYSAVSTMSERGMIDGYNDGSFKPDNHITRAELVTMLTRGNTEKFVGVPFNDVFSNRWYADYIYTAYKHKYIDGYGDSTFRPENPITRAETVKIINGYLGRNDYSNEEKPFKDVSDDHWAYKEVLEAAISHKYESGE